MSKVCTSLEQSKKLIEFGIDVNTADMYWAADTIPLSCFPLNGIETDWDYSQENEFVPAWSLAALVDIFPCSKESPSFTLTRGGWNPSFTRDWYAVWEEEDTITSINADNPVDAVVGLIVKMKETITKDMKQN